MRRIQCLSFCLGKRDIREKRRGHGLQERAVIPGAEQHENPTDSNRRLTPEEVVAAVSLSRNSGVPKSIGHRVRLRIGAGQYGDVSRRHCSLNSARTAKAQRLANK
jgi:hypothetical protein